jgi:tetratricopeptide (TPR) repeat protein
MSRKKKRAKPAAAAGVVSAGPDSTDSAGVADAMLGAARYKEAIEQFKELLKRERRPAWLAGLAAAYGGRAEQLAAKGMVKEALALWRTRAETCGVPLLDGPYLDWLTRSGQIELALSLLPEVEKLPPEARDRARSRLAPSLLVASDHLLAGLDEETMRHRAAARAAIATCARGDTSGLDQALQAISFRSPFRDLRPLLKALVLRVTDPIAAAASLARVADDGPFRALAQALRVCLMPQGEWLAGLRGLDDAGRALVLDLKGCPQPQRLLVLDSMTRAGTAATTPLELLDLLLRHRRVIPAAAARRLAWRLLPHAPQRLDAFRASFAAPSAAELEQVLALAAELKQRPENAEPHWLRMVRLLGNTPAGQRRAAMVLRHLADEHAQHSPDGTLCTHAQDWLEQSLRLDPSDRITHLRLLRDARLRGDLKQARRGVEAAREQFPADALVLQEAVEIALAAGAFKKAAGLAKQVLQADPINPRVRTLIGQAHLAHARKLIGARNLQAARRELDEAANWLRSPSERGLLELLRGFAAEPAASGDALLRQAVADLGGPLVGAFHLLLESQRAKFRSASSPNELLRRAAVDAATTPAAPEVVALARALHAVAERDAALRPVVGALGGMLGRAAASTDFSETDLLLVCEALQRHRLSDLTRRFAAAALKRWPGRPAFVYFEADANFGAEPWRMPQREWQRLDRTYEQARDQGDERTANRLSKLLGAAEGPGSDAMPPDLDDLDTEDVRDVMESLLELGGEDEFLNLARKQLGKSVFDQFRREFKGGKKEFAKALVDLLSSAAQPSPPVRIIAPPAPPAKPAKQAKPPMTNENQPDLFDD